MTAYWSPDLQLFVKRFSWREIRVHQTLDDIEKSAFAREPNRRSGLGIPRPTSPPGIDPGVTNMRYVPSLGGNKCDAMYVSQFFHGYSTAEGEDLPQPPDPANILDTETVVAVGMRVFAGIAWQLDVLHDHGVSHGDVKLENVACTRKLSSVNWSQFGAGKGDATFTLIDFGKSSCSDWEDKAEMPGTPAYYSPDAIRCLMQSDFYGIARYSHRDAQYEDVYGLAMTTLALVAPTILSSVLNFRWEGPPCPKQRIQGHPLVHIARMQCDPSKRANAEGEVMNYIISVARSVRKEGAEHEGHRLDAERILTLEDCRVDERVAGCDASPQRAKQRALWGGFFDLLRDCLDKRMSACDALRRVTCLLQTLHAS